MVLVVPAPALIYTRVSEDRSGGRSPKEQEAEARQVCEREGWEVLEVVTDSVGASRHSKGTRPGWARVLKMLSTGKVDILVTWEASRAQRDLAAYAALRDLCARHGVRWSYKGRTYDLASSGDRFTTGLDGLLAERESDEISDRVKRAMRASAAQGRPPGRRLFGYQRTYDATTGRLVGQEPHDTEAAIVRGIFDGFLGGQGIRTLARELNRRSVTTSTGASWADTQIKRVLTNSAYTAKRVHRGEVIGAADWPPLVDSETFDRVQARLAAMAQRRTRHTRTARLLTGVGRCGTCGGKLSAGHDRHRRKVYQCRTGFCVARDLLKLDAFISSVVVERLSRPDVTEALRGVAPDPAFEVARDRAQQLRAQLDDAVDQFTRGELTGATLAKVEARLLPLIAEVEQDARRALVPLEVEVPADDVFSWWESLTSEIRREVLATLIAAVVVMPTGRGRRELDPSAIRVEWRR